MVVAWQGLWPQLQCQFIITILSPMWLDKELVPDCKSKEIGKVMPDVQRRKRNAAITRAGGLIGSANKRKKSVPTAGLIAYSSVTETYKFVFNICFKGGYISCCHDGACQSSQSWFCIHTRQRDQKETSRYIRQKIHLHNIFPGCTIGWYRNALQLLSSMHTDDFNCRRRGHNVQMVASKTFSGNDGGLQQ